MISIHTKKLLFFFLLTSTIAQCMEEQNKTISDPYKKIIIASDAYKNILDLNSLLESTIKKEHEYFKQNNNNILLEDIQKIQSHQKEPISFQYATKSLIKNLSTQIINYEKIFLLTPDQLAKQKENSELLKKEIKNILALEHNDSIIKKFDNLITQEMLKQIQHLIDYKKTLSPDEQKEHSELVTNKIDLILTQGPKHIKFNMFVTLLQDNIALLDKYLNY